MAKQKHLKVTSVQYIVIYNRYILHIPSCTQLSVFQSAISIMLQTSMIEKKKDSVKRDYISQQSWHHDTRGKGKFDCKRVCTTSS
jgi:hypothetical protein